MWRECALSCGVLHPRSVWREAQREAVHLVALQRLALAGGRLARRHVLEALAQLRRLAAERVAPPALAELSAAAAGRAARRMSGRGQEAAGRGRGPRGPGASLWARRAWRAETSAASTASARQSMRALTTSMIILELVGPKKSA